MKILLIFAVIFAFLLSSCSKEPEEVAPEIPESEISESALEEKPQEETLNPVYESVPEKEPETKSEWEKFIDEKIINGYTREEIESLENCGFSREEIMSMQWMDFSRNLSMIKFGFEREEVESVLKILQNEELKDKTFVSSGDNTENYELIEKFISAVERDEPAFVHGTMAGNPLYFYFELSYEPGGLIEYSMISEFKCSKAEFSEIYDTEVFCRFENGEESLMFPKIELWPGEELKFSPERDVPGKPVTLEEAIEIAAETMFSTNLANDEYEYTEEFLNSFEPRCSKIVDIAGKPYYRIGFYKGESPDGGTYYICADESKIVFRGSEVDGRLIPIAAGAKPRVVLKNG